MRVGAKEKEKEMGGGQENSGNRARIVWDGEASPASRSWKTKGAREHRKGGTPRRGGVARFPSSPPFAWPRGMGSIKFRGFTHRSPCCLDPGITNS